MFLVVSVTPDSEPSQLLAFENGERTITAPYGAE